MKLNDESIALLDKIKKTFPFLMPQKIRMRHLDYLAMVGAGVAREQNDTQITPEHILIGAHRAWPADFVNLICTRLRLDPAKKAQFQKKAAELDYVSVETLLDDLKTIAEKYGTEIQEDRLRPILDCYKQVIETGAIYIKATTRDLTPKEFFIRPGHAGRWFDMAAIAKNCGIANFDDNPAYLAYSSICRKIDSLGSMVDISAQGKIHKLYTFTPRFQPPLRKIQNCKYVPASIAKNVPLIESWGFKRFSIFGADLIHNSMNFYCYTDQTTLDQAKIEAMFAKLGFPMPSDAMLAEMVDAAMIYFTFTHESDRIERICFTRVYEESMEKAIALAPSLKKYIEESPIKSAKRNLLLGFTFSEKGHYLKFELDYKASVFIPKVMKYSGLYCDPKSF